jgi:hypothetical protein
LVQLPGGKIDQRIGLSLRKPPPLSTISARPFLQYLAAQAAPVMAAAARAIVFVNGIETPGEVVDDDGVDVDRHAQRIDFEAESVFGVMPAAANDHGVDARVDDAGHDATAVAVDGPIGN